MCEKHHCKKCDRLMGMCICDLSSYTSIGDVSGCTFLDDHVSYKEGAGSAFFQGWAYKHNQMKSKLYEKDLQISELDKFVSELMVVAAAMIGIPSGREEIKLLDDIYKSDAWKKRESELRLISRY